MPNPLQHLETTHVGQCEVEQQSIRQWVFHRVLEWRSSFEIINYFLSVARKENGGIHTGPLERPLQEQYVPKLILGH